MGVSLSLLADLNLGACCIVKRGAPSDNGELAGAKKCNKPTARVRGVNSVSQTISFWGQTEGNHGRSLRWAGGGKSPLWLRVDVFHSVKYES